MKPVVRAIGGCSFFLSVIVPSSYAASIAVRAGDSLQAAIDAAQPGDTLLLEPGATFRGNFVLRPKSGDGWVTIRSRTDDANLPAAGERMSPRYGSRLARIESPNSAAAIRTAAFAHHYVLALLEIGANRGGYGDIIELGDGSANQNELSIVPHDLVIDRVYIHGDPVNGQKRGVALNSGAATVTGSYISDCKAVGQDSQAIAGWNGPGPYTITNNYLEAAGENLLFGGADPAIPNLVPSDITIRGNHFSKPTAWRAQSWSVKNLLELKNAQRVVIDANLLEYNWQAAQPGYAVLFTPRNQDGTAPWTIVQQVAFTNNVVRHVSSGINILGTDNLQPSLPTSAITIRGNLFTDVSSANWGGIGRFMLASGAANITVDHNTILQDGSSVLYAYGSPLPGFVFTNNIVPPSTYTIMGENSSPGNATIATFLPGGTFQNNVLTGASASRFPSGNYFPATLAAIGFDANGTYALATDSPFRGVASDHGDVGCAIDALAAAYSAAVSAETPQLTPPVPVVPPVPSSVTASVVWQRQTDGALALWALQSSSVVWSALVPESGHTDSAWQIAGAADFNADGSIDLLWRNARSGELVAWLLDGASLRGVAAVGPTVGLSWRPVGLADFDGDGHPDLLWRSDLTGELAVWMLDGVNLRSISMLNPDRVGDLAWRVVGIGDFDRDGSPDLLWRHTATGQLGVWYMRGTALRDVAMITPAVPDPQWQVAGVADVNGDGNVDVIWRNLATGMTGVWLLQGLTLESATMIGAVDSTWRAAGAR